MQYVELEEDGKDKKEKVTWRRREVGIILGLSIWDATSIAPLSLALHDAESARKEADLHQSRSSRH